jgi:hypothetical protein
VVYHESRGKSTVVNFVGFHHNDPMEPYVLPHSDIKNRFPRQWEAWMQLFDDEKKAD